MGRTALDLTVERSLSPLPPWASNHVRPDPTGHGGAFFPMIVIHFPTHHSGERRYERPNDPDAKSVWPCLTQSSAENQLTANAWLYIGG